MNTLVVLLILVSYVRSDLVILEFRQSNQNLEICALKKPIKNSNDLNQELNLENLNGYDGCVPVPIEPRTDSSAFYLRIPKPECSFSEMAKNLQEKNPRLVIIGTDGPISINTTLTNLTVPYAFMADEFAQKVTDFLNPRLNSTVKQTSLSRFDGSLLVIWLIACMTIVFGGLWTRYEFNTTLIKPIENDRSVNFVDETSDNHNVNTSNLIQDQSNNSKKDDDKHALTISVGYLSIFILLVFVVGMLLMLYYFYNYMIYIIYAIFCFGAASAIYRIGSLLFDNVKFLSFKLPTLNLPLNKKLNIKPFKVILFAISITICALWFVFRHEEWSWTLQNVMAISLASSALSFYRLSKYKTVTIILVVFFLYDIFMVFITPTFTKGTSIMEAVAFGGKDASASNGPQDWSNLQFGNRSADTSNRLPVVIIIPHLNKERRLCSYYYDFSFSLLGLGDILVPGLSVNYAIIFDRANNKTRYPIYFIVNVIAYIIGLFLAFIGLLFMNTAQPALLYLCPILLIFSYITTLIRRETKLYWSGAPISELISMTQLDRITNGQIESTKQLDEENVQG